MNGLYTIVETLGDSRLDPVSLAQNYLKGGARILQLREKKASRGQRLQWAKEIASFKDTYDFNFIINDDPEIVAEVGADGVHLGQNDRSIKEARKIIGPAKIIGRSTHSLEEALVAQREEADYIAFGAVFPTSSKPPGHIVVGLEGLREVIRRVSVPVVAIGGINRSNINSVVETGVHSIAMISALTGAPDIVGETTYFVSRL